MHRLGSRGFCKGIIVIIFLSALISIITIIKPLINNNNNNYSNKNNNFIAFSSSSSQANISDETTIPCEHISSESDKCSFVLNHCTKVNALFPYLKFRYCTMIGPGLPGLAYLIFFLVLFLCISMLASTAEYFFVPSLQYLSDQLKLTPAVAGITLLALGNGAPDIFTAIAGLEADDFPLVLGGLVGASMFIASVVLGSVLLASQHESLKVDKTSFIRDVAVYLIATITIIVIALSHSIALWQAALFIVLYLLYVAIVIIHSRIRKAQKVGLTYRASLLPAEAFNSTGTIIEDEMNGSVSMQNITEFRALSDNPNENNINQLDSPDTIDSTIRNLLHQLETEEQQEEENNPDFFVGINWPSDPSIINRIQYIVELPFAILRWLSSPPADGKWSYRRRVAWIIHPFMFITVILIACVGLDDFASTTVAESNIPLISILYPAAALLSLFIYCLTNNTRLPPFYPLFSLISFVSAIVWLNLIASECVSILQTFGLMLDISTSLLGLTVLAVGNSVGDWVSDVAVAKAGSPATSIAACFGSPLLNDVFGLGISLTITTSKLYPKLFEFGLNSQLYVGWSFLCVALLCSAIIFPLTRFKPPRSFAFGLIGLYAGFVLFIVLLEVGAFK